MQSEKVIPYTTKAGLKIGCMYQPEKHYSMSRDMEHLQTVLISSRQPQKPGFIDRLKDYVNNIVRVDV